MFVWCSNYRNRRCFRNRIARENNKPAKVHRRERVGNCRSSRRDKILRLSVDLMHISEWSNPWFTHFSVSRNEKKRQFCGVAKDNKWISICWDFEVFRFYRLDDISDKVFQRFYSCRSVFGQCLTCFVGSSLPSLFHNYFNHRTLETVAKWRWKPTNCT